MEDKKSINGTVDIDSIITKFKSSWERHCNIRDNMSEFSESNFRFAIALSSFSRLKILVRYAQSLYNDVNKFLDCMESDANDFSTWESQELYTHCKYLTDELKNILKSVKYEQDLLKKLGY